MKKKLLALICFGFSFFSGCQQPHLIGDHCPPFAFNFFLLDKNGKSLITAPDQKIDFYYINDKGRQNPDSGCQECMPIRSASSYGPYDYYYSTATAVDLSGKGIRDFYIDLNGDIDTIYLELGLMQGSDCNTIKQVRLNGKDPVTNLPSTAFPSFYGFVLQKKN